MKIIARHERDDQDYELSQEDIAKLKSDFGVTDSNLENMIKSNAVLRGNDGWEYRPVRSHPLAKS